MAKGDFGSAAFLNKQMKARGLQKLKYYCQLCEKQCRDDNGFRSHIKSPSHLRKISKVTKEDIEEYSDTFEKSFLKLLKVSHGEKKISANKFYNEFIQDRDHIHMNATKFSSLNRFIQHLSKNGKIKVHGIDDIEANGDKIDMGQLQISYIDNSYETLSRKEKLDEIDKNRSLEQNISQIMLMKQISDGHKTMTNDKKNDSKDLSDVVDKQSSNSEPININIKRSKINKVKHKKSNKNIFGKK